MDSTNFLPEKYDFSNVETDTSIEEFFSKEEYKNMCDLEKLRFKNLRLNYEMMLKFGLQALKPDFMKPNWGRSKQTVNDHLEPESDEEWRPRPKRKAGPKPWHPPFRPPSATVTSAQTSGGKNKKKTRQTAEKPKEERRVYSFRKRKEVNYMKLEVPNDDEFIYCEECDQEFQGDCPQHGPLHEVEDTAVEKKKRADPQRAMKTLPPGLEVKESVIPNAGLGVFATQFFPSRSRFGPYQGRRVTDPDIAHSSGYCWQICTDEGYSYFVDAKDCKTANWMRYVNCARTRAEQNVTAYQHCGEVYYRAHCDIQPGTEILVWYGREYGKELGIIREEEDEPKKKKRSSVVQLESLRDEETDEQLTCSNSDVRTSDIEFSDSADSQRDKKQTRMVKKAEKGVTSATTTPAHHPLSSNKPSPHKPANTCGPLLSLDRSHLCQRCSAAFVMFNSLKLHMNFVHGEKLQPVLPVPSIPDTCDDGNHGDNDMAKKGVGAGRSKTVERMKNETDCSHTGEKRGGQHVSDVCSKAFTRASSLKTHKLIHTGHKPFVSDVCSKAFTEASNLKTHKLIHTGHKPFVSDVCSKAFTRASSLKTHKLIHTGHKPFVSDVCSKAFTEASNLKTHKLIHTGHKPFVSDVCSKAFTRASSLKAHKLIHTGHKRFVCDVCSKAFTEAGNLKTHKLIHTGHKPFVCDVCSKVFTESGNLKRHKLIHTGHKPFVCDVCSKAFTRAGHLKTHKLIHTGHKWFVCDVCSKACTQAGHLKTHKLIHTGHKRFVCDVCSKAFTEAGNLKTHRRIHTGEKPYQCPHCDSDFNRSTSLQTHIMSVHAGDRPYVCDVCGKAFSETGNLKKHKRIHTSEKPYICDVCGKAFSRTGDLKTHKRIHTSEKPYICDVCGKAFSQTGNLKTHKRIHTGENLTSAHCGKKFADPRTLNKILP